MTVQLTASRRLVLLFLSSASLAACDRRPTTAGASKVSAGALQQANLDARTKAFYEARQWRPGWNAKTARQLETAVDGLSAHAIAPDKLKAMMAVKGDAQREAALTSTALAYGDILAHGAIDPSKVYEIAAIDRNDVKVDPGLSEALDKGDIDGWLKALPPQDVEYQALSKAYQDFSRQSGQASPAIPDGKPIKPGAHDPRVAQIAAALGVAPDADPAKYAKPIVEAVKGFQNSQGINDDGVIGADTIAVLNAGPTDRARQLALNLEARRWLKRERPATRIDVNTASAILYYYRDNKVADKRRVVAGKPDAETPLLSGEFKQLVVNPPWNVPQGIAEKEILPKGAGYLRSQDMVVEDGRVIQKPGPKAALGRVKFDMQNKYAIYLHDTPSKAAFQANERHGSHGCVRVDGAVDFARKLAAERNVADDFDKKLAEGETETVALNDTVPVRLAYHTAFLDPGSNQVAFRPDVYGWDEKLATALGLPAPMKRVVQNTAADMGP